jgi:type I restriction enzyme M protein
MRLPAGISYKPGVKANVLFFDKHPPRADGKPNTKTLWIYDFRTNMPFILRKNTLKPSDLDDFVKCYSLADRSKRKPTERSRGTDSRHVAAQPKSQRRFRKRRGATDRHDHSYDLRFEREEI